MWSNHIINILKKPKDISITKPIARKIEVRANAYFNKQTTNVFTFIFPEKDSNTLDSAIIINVSEFWVRKVITALNLDKSDNIFIVDGKGKIISSIFEKEIQEDVSKDTDYSFIRDLKKPSGYFIDKFNGGKSLITYVSTESLDWKFIRVVPYSKITVLLNHVRNITLIICLIILCVGLISSFIISKKIYKPINDVILNLRAIAKEKSKSSKQLKEEYLKALILEEVSLDINVFNKNIVDYNIKVTNEDNVSMIILKIDHFLDFCNKYNYNDRGILKYGIINITCEILENSYNYEVIDVGIDHLVILINQSPQPSEQELITLETKIKAIQANVSKCLNVFLSCTVGPLEYSLSDIRKLYLETIKVSYYRVFYGLGSIIYFKDINITEEYIYPIDLEKSLIDFLLLSKLEDVKRLYQVLINDDFCHYYYPQFNSTLLRIAFSISSAIETIERAQNLKVDYNFSHFIAMFSNLETLDEIKAHFFNMFDEISLKLEKKRIFKHDDLINKIIEIIKIEYMDTNLCLDSIADSVDMSSVYLGRLFKKNMCKSVADYINVIRMEHAVTYLVTTDMSINDIVEKVGYSTRSYFHTVFKKEYATTPNEYRKNLKNN